MSELALSTSSLPQVIDATMRRTFASCQRKMFWEFVNNLATSETSVHLHFGGAVARGIETLYRESYFGDEKLALPRAIWDALAYWGDFVPQKETYKTKTRIQDVLTEYKLRYSPPNDYIAPNKNFANPFEYTFAIPLTKEAFGLDFPLHPSGDPFIYAGRFDMVGEHAGLLRIRDDKTTSALGASWAKQWILRDQLIGYVACMQILGFDVDTVELRGIALLKSEIKFQEAVCSYASHVVSRWKEQLARDVAALVRAFESGIWNYDFGEACAAYGGCPYLDLCRVKDPESYFSTFAQRNWNPLDKKTLEKTDDNNANGRSDLGEARPIYVEFG